MKRISVCLILLMIICSSVRSYGGEMVAPKHKVSKTIKKKNSRRSKSKITDIKVTRPKEEPLPDLTVPSRPSYTLNAGAKSWDTGLIVAKEGLFYFKNNSCSFRKHSKPQKHVRSYRYDIEGDLIKLSCDVDSLVFMQGGSEFKIIGYYKKGKRDDKGCAKFINAVVFDYFPFDPETAYCGADFYFVHQGDKWIEVRPNLYRGIWGQYVTDKDDAKSYKITNGFQTVVIPKKVKYSYEDVTISTQNGKGGRDDRHYGVINHVLDNKKSKRPVEVDEANLVTSAMSMDALRYDVLSRPIAKYDIGLGSNGHLIFLGVATYTYIDLLFTRDGLRWKKLGGNFGGDNDYFYVGQFDGRLVFRDASGENIIMYDRSKSKMSSLSRGLHIHGSDIKDDVKFKGEFSSFSSKGSHIMALAEYNAVTHYLVKDGYRHEIYDKTGLVGAYDQLDPAAKEDYVCEGDNGRIEVSGRSVKIYAAGKPSSIEKRKIDFGKEIDTNRPLVASARMKTYLARKAKEEKARKLAEKKRKQEEKKKQQQLLIAKKKQEAAAKKKAEAEKILAAKEKRRKAKQNANSSARKSGTDNGVSSNQKSSSVSSAANRPNSPQPVRYERRRWREGNSYGFTECEQFENGVIHRKSYLPCSMCRGAKVCANCAGTRMCQLCHGRGGIVSAGYGNFYPCSLCGATGRCNICGGAGVCICINSDHPGYSCYAENFVSPDGRVLSNSNYGGGSSSASSAGRSSGSSNRSSSSSRYGYNDCSTCHGTGTCQTCNGSGFTSVYTTNEYLCPNCYANYTKHHDDWGKCNTCNGTGKTYGVRR